jgi:hypothetical protein
LDKVIVIVCKCFVTKIAKLLEYYKFEDMFSDIKLYKLSIIYCWFLEIQRWHVLWEALRICFK